MPFNEYYGHECSQGKEQTESIAQNPYEDTPTCDVCGEEFTLIAD